MRKELFMAKRGVLNRRQLVSHKRLCANQMRSVDELVALNWERRKALVDYAFEHNSFYHKKYSAVGFQLGDLKAPVDFEALPLLEKSEIKAHEQELVSRGFTAETLRFATTGGSTGVPLKTYCDPSAPANELSWRMLNWWNVDVSDSSAYFYRAIPSAVQQRVQKMLLWPTQRHWLAADDMGDERLTHFYRQLCRSKPRYLIGYVGALDVFAHFLERNKYALAGIKAVWTTAAPLLEGKRRYLQHLLKAPVYTQYGSSEFYWISAECRRQNGLHLANDVRHIDVVEKGEPVAVGSYGDLLVTDLMNRAFPLIRYRLGDRGRLLARRCACGLPFPLMDYVEGRISDTVHLPSGERVPGEVLAGIFRDYPEAIQSFQIRQAADYSLTLYYEPQAGGHSYAAEVEAILVKLRQIMQGQVPVTAVAGGVDVNDNGKTRFFISELES